MIDSNLTVLDVGCGDGTLMKMLQEKNIHTTGIDIDQDNIIKCLEKDIVYNFIEEIKKESKTIG
jgi:2-polyprenyl-3-methyl-5-hydroxy-6-metoxy-1,4-benzoquinol methylase